MSRSPGVTVLSAILLILGLGAFAPNLYAMLALPDAQPLSLSVLGIVYGVLALLAARWLWMRSSRAVAAYIAWSASIGAYFVALVYDEPKLAQPLIAVPVIAASGILYLGYRFISRACRPAA